MTKQFFAFFVIFVFAFSCSSDRKFAKTPVDTLIQQLDQEKNFTIILYDMDMEENTFSDDVFKHKYKIITLKDSTPVEKVTDWYPVTQEVFMRHQNDLGMEVASKNNGKVSKVTAPPGFSNYVGNAQYGQWRTDNSGNSFWEFYGKYAMLSSMFGLASSMIHRNTYYDYHDNYRGRQPYYGQLGGGQPMFGTNSEMGRRANPDFHARTGGGNKFKNRINERISRSSRPSGSGSGGGSSRPRMRRRR